jgi:hypothetical protein
VPGFAGECPANPVAPGFKAMADDAFSLKAGVDPKQRLDVRGMSAKEILLEVAEKLPPDATLSDVIYELEFRQAVQQGLDELDRGEGMPIEQVRSKIAEWAGK